jgi:hypothetical protein
MAWSPAPAAVYSIARPRAVPGHGGGFAVLLSGSFTGCVVGIGIRRGAPGAVYSGDGDRRQRDRDGSWRRNSRGGYEC